MAITINGSGTVTGISVGGLPDGIVDAGTLASNSVETAKIAANAVTSAKADPALGKVINSYSRVITASSTISNTTSDVIKSPNITPASTSSKFIITVTFNWSSDNPNTGVFLYRETSGPTYSNLNPTQSIDGNFGTADGHVLDIDENHTDNNWSMETWSQSFIDSPNTTSQINYTLRFQTAASVTIYVNRTVSSASYNAVTTMNILELSS